jgi:uncharacterized protein (DUF362 family)
MRRRDFLRALGVTMGAFWVCRWAEGSQAADVAGVDLSIARNSPPADLVRRAVAGLGGMGRFVSKGSIVVVKPNIGWDRTPEQAANTNPEVVGEVARLCFEAGAKTVKVFDRTCNEPRRCYNHSGIRDAATKAGAEVYYLVDSRFSSVSLPKGEAIKSWSLYRDALDCDALINVPIAKHHGLSRLTMAFKNLMGIMGDDRGEIHSGFERKIVDVATRVKPNLTILDATRVLLRNGPQGGRLSDVQELKTVVAGVDMVAVDSYGATLFGLKGTELPYLVNASKRGLGQIDLAKLKIKTV